MRSFVLCILTIACIGTLPAQGDLPSLTWSGNVRVRSELDMRDFNLKTPGNGYTLLRARMGVEALPVKHVRVFLQVQDSRVFGQERDGTGSFNTLSDTRNLDLHQGYLEVGNLFSGLLAVRIGRQELIYGGERLIGAVGWNNIARAFDGVVFRFEQPELSVDLLAMNVGEVQAYAPAATPAAVQYVPDSGADLFGAYATFTGHPNHTLEGYFLYQWDRNQGAAGNDDLRRYTLGGYLRGNDLPLDYEVDLAHQGGRRRGADVSAYLLAGTVGYLLEGSPVRRIAVGYDHLTGTPEGTTTHRSFDPMFHTGHKFYGFMDYLTAFPSHTANRGLTDLYLRTTFSFSDQTSFNVWLHQFAYEKDVAGKKALGQEVDCVLFYQYNPAVVFEFGACAFVPEELMRQRFNGAGTSFWGYLTATVNF